MMDSTRLDAERTTRPGPDSERPTMPRVEPPPLRWLRRWGFRWLHVLDALTLYGTMLLLSFLRFGLSWPTYPVSHYLIGFAIATAIHLTVLYFGGAYEPEQRLGQRAWLPRIARLMFVGILVDAAAALATGRFLMPRLNLIGLFVIGTLGLTANRWISRRLRSRRFGPARVLLVGPPDDIGLARAHLSKADRSARIVGARPTARHLDVSVAETGASDVLLLSSDMLDDIYPEPLATLESDGTGVLQRIVARDTLLGLQAVRQIDGMPFVPLRTHAMPPSRARFKRVVELVVLLVTLPLTLPVLAFTALYVRIVAGPGIIFHQQRVGKAGQPFTMLKFRTMRPTTLDVTGEMAGIDSERIIPRCRWLRATRFDELPQLINVVKGEMSLVGPRPEVPELTEQFDRIVPGYSRRHEIPPGLTGLAQVHGHYHTDASYKLGHDIQYLVNWSPILDLEILVWTVWVVLRRRI